MHKCIREAVMNQKAKCQGYKTVKDPKMPYSFTASRKGKTANRSVHRKISLHWFCRQCSSFIVFHVVYLQEKTNRLNTFDKKTGLNIWTTKPKWCTSTQDLMNPLRPRYTQNEVQFHSSFRCKTKLKICEQWYTVSEHPNAAHSDENNV